MKKRYIFAPVRRESYKAHIPSRGISKTEPPAPVLFAKRQSKRQVNTPCSKSSRRRESGYKGQRNPAERETAQVRPTGQEGGRLLVRIGRQFYRLQYRTLERRGAFVPAQTTLAAGFSGRGISFRFDMCAFCRWPAILLLHLKARERDRAVFSRIFSRTRAHGATTCVPARRGGRAAYAGAKYPRSQRAACCRVAHPLSRGVSFQGVVWCGQHPFA